jgi:AcrR family transcriptional regulator
MSEILNLAETLFQKQGYPETSLSQIAEAANLPLADLQALYPSKEHLALAIYQRLSEKSESLAANLISGSISERYFLFLESRLPLLNEHEGAVSALFASAMLPHSAIKPAMISPAKTDPILKALRALVEGSEDSPKEGNDSENLALLLYSFHFLVMIFWLYDRTEAKQASQHFVHFLRDFVKLTRPMMIMPLISKALHKLTQITLLIFGGAKIVE